ncbi:MAG: hydrogenase maturation protease [Desulfobulbus sp.]
MEKEWIIIGIGNPHLQDDRAGVVVIERLEEEGIGCRTETICTVGLEVMDKVQGYRKAIIVDACMLGNKPGSVLELSLDEIFTTPSLANSHALTLGTTLKTGYVCFPEEMPSELYLILIEVRSISEFTRQMSPEVEAAVERVRERIWALVRGA